MLYVTKKLSIRETADRLSLSEHAVRKELQRAKIPFRAPGPQAGKVLAPHPQLPEVVALYVDKGLTTDQIAERLSLGTSRVKRWLKKAGVTMRPKGPAPSVHTATWNAALDAVLATWPEAPDAVAELKR